MSLADWVVADEAAHIFAYHSDCLPFLRSLPDNWCHAIITDPPYGLGDAKPDVVAAAITAWATGDRERVPDGRGFMGRRWDAFVPPPAVWDECLRVLRPGGHLAVFAGSRTADLMGLSIRLAGFDMRDGISAWLYGSGFPKSHDVGRAIDARGARGADSVVLLKAELRRIVDESGMTLSELNERCGFEASGYLRTSSTWATLFPPPEKWRRMREVVGGDDQLGEKFRAAEREVIGARDDRGRTRTFGGGASTAGDITAPATDAARAWSGWGTALKPAHEPILIARKPLQGTVAANTLAHGCGGLNVDACRVGDGHDRSTGGAQGSMPQPMSWGEATGRERPEGGRWPTNVALAHAPELDPVTGEVLGDACADGCVPGCHVAALDEQSGATGRTGAQISCNGQSIGDGVILNGGGAAETRGHGDQGGASRFYPQFRYTAKAGKRERPQVAGRGHPTVKPLGLMQWLVRLLVPTAEQLGRDENGHGPGAGLLIDPFAGSGTTLEAARLERVRAVGIEADEHSCQLIAARLTRAGAGVERVTQPDLFSKPA